MGMTGRPLAALACALVAGALVACGGNVALPEAGKMPITTASRAASKEYLKGRDLVEKLRGGEAAAHFQKAADLDPTFALAFLGLANTAPGPAQFFPALRRAVDLAPRVSEAEANLILAAQAGVSSRPDEQRRRLEANVKAFPADERAHSLLGNFLFAAQEWPAAIAEYRRAIAINPKFSPPYNQLGYALRYLERNEEAEAAFCTYVELIPGEPNPYDSHAELLLHLGRYRDAIAEYQKALDLNPNFPSAYVGIGHALIFLGEAEEARKCFVKLRFIARNDGETRQASLWLAASYLFEGDHDRAIFEISERLEMAKRKNDLLSASGDLELIAELLLDAGRADGAQARFDEALALLDRADVPPAIRETGHVDYLFDTARVDLTRGDLASATRKAESYRRRAQERRIPDEIRRSHLLLGLLASASGNHARAVEEIGKANLNDARVLLALARAQAASGDVKTAIGTCRRALVFNRPDLSNAFVRRPGQALLKDLLAAAPQASREGE